MKTTNLLIILIILPLKLIYSKGNEEIDIKKDASAIIENYTENFEIRNNSKAVRTVQYDITILKKSGDKFGAFYEVYDEFQKIKIKKARIFNSKGEEIKKIRKKDFNDQSIVSGYSLYEDNRIMFYKPQINSYPYTVSYEYKIKYSGLLQYPSWKPQFYYDIGVRNASFEVTVPQKIGLHFKQHNLQTKPVEHEENNHITYKWEVNNLKPIKKEPLSPPFKKIAPRVLLAPDNFEIDNYAGKLDSWKNFGKWITRLNEGKQNLTSSTKNKIIQMVDTMESTNEKIKKIYNYVQANTRYVSIQLGIGSWQPFESETVEKLGYGDCKALANYTRSLLAVAGIKSHYALIQSTSNPFLFDENFPSNQFNHAILCVPNQGDTIWLETTSKTKPAGYIGRQCSNRKALTIKPNGGKLLSTPRYKDRDNLQIQTSEVILSENGDGIVSAQTVYNGLQYDFFLNQSNKNKKEQERWIYKNLNLADFKILKHNYKQSKTNETEGIRHLELKIDRYALKSGNRLFLPLNLLNKNTYIPERVNERNTKVQITLSYFDKDTVTYHIPDGYKIEYLPEEENFKSDIGTYKKKIIEKNGKITYIREMKLKKGLYSKDKYAKIRKFFKKVVESDEQKAVLVKKEL